MELKVEVREAFHAECALGEGVVWDSRRAVVWFVDIKKRDLWLYDPQTNAGSRTGAAEQIGWALPAENGLLLCGLKNGLHTFDPEEQTFRMLAALPGEPQGNRLNDACTDSHGRVWMGTMDDSEKKDTGRFFLFDRGEILPRGPSRITVTNGPAVSPDGKTIYFVDSLKRLIMSADLFDDGQLGKTRLFVDTADYFSEAYPDGPVCDSEGYLWIGLFGGGRIARFAPNGQLESTIQMPTSNPTKLCFGGDDMKTAYVSSARVGLSDEKLRAQPLAGSLLMFESPVAGFAREYVKLPRTSGSR